jgi:hypothetical protein
MKPRPPAELLALVVLLVALGPRPTRAAERGCAAVAIEPDAGFRARFPDLLSHIQELAARADIDACAHVALHSANDAGIDVSVTLPDGRTASRSVARREDVMPTLQALLLVPDQPPPVSAPAPSPAPKTKREGRGRIERVEPAEPGAHDAPSAPAPAARELGFELSAISGVRVGDGQFGYGGGVLSFLQIHSWLVGFQGRADGYRSIYGSDPETALELAILGGRRFDFGSVALDFTAGPAMAMKGVTFSQVQRVEFQRGEGASMPPATRPPPPDESGSGPVPRFLLGARLGFSPRSVFRTFVGIDGELGPSHVSADPEATVSSSRMPRFTVGLALGATVGTL